MHCTHINRTPAHRAPCNMARPLELVCSLQKQVSVMSMNLSAKLDELQRGDRHLETTVALCEIRTQLQELTKSVESCQSEVSEVSAKEKEECEKERRRLLMSSLSNWIIIM